jgi:uncharacterized cupin superfamily protein
MSAPGEAKLQQTESGLRPERAGWFVVNVSEAAGTHTDDFGAGVRFEGGERFPGIGINVRLLQPGQPNALYHRESAAEAFLVLSGECTAVIEEQERTLRKGDFLYTPPETAHVIVGAGEGPAVVLMAGARPERSEISFPVSEAASRYGASVDRETDDVREAYGEIRNFRSGRVELSW